MCQELAFGNFSLPFTDLSVNIAGIPIAITRSYDTRDAGQSLEFGHGWRLNLGKSTLKTENTAAGGFGVGCAFRDGTRVFVSLPGQRPMGFTFAPTSRDNFLAPETFYPAFTADPGVTAILAPEGASGDYLSRSRGEYVLGYENYNQFLFRNYLLT